MIINSPGSLQSRPVCPLDLLEEVRSQIKTPNFLYLIEDGDHSFRLTKRELQAGGKTQKNVDQRILAAISKFVHEDIA